MVPLTTARYPNRNFNVLNWSHVEKVNADGSSVPDNATAGRLAGWAAALERDPENVYVHFGNSIGWADRALQMTSVSPSAGTFAIGSCGPDDYKPAVKDYFSVYGNSLFEELDAPGEYTVHTATGLLYVYPPDADWWATSEWGTAVEEAMLGRKGAAGTPTPAPAAAGADSIVGEVTVAPNVLVLDGAAYLSFSGITFTSARGAGVVLNNASFVTFDNCTVQAVGAQAVNVTGGSNITISNSLIQGAALGGVYLYAGDRTTLTPSNHVIVNSSLSYNHRWMYCYLPLVATGGVGHSIAGSEIYGAPHMGIFLSGNNHLIQGNTVHDVVQVVRDSGALYGGREWTYRGNVIDSNLFTRINSVMSGDDVSAVYLDDSLSGISITRNEFINVSRALLLGGGRDNLFANNIIRGSNSPDAAIHLDDRDLNWAASACNVTANGILVQFLGRVPYNTSAAWIAAYPHLPDILQDGPCVPKYNAIVNNTICGSNGPWIDVTNASLASWGSTEWANVNIKNC